MWIFSLWLKILLGASTAHLTAWGRDTFANTKPNYFRSGSCRRAALPGISPL
jgi:hypothetical protein